MLGGDETYYGRPLVALAMTELREKAQLDLHR